MVKLSFTPMAVRAPVDVANDYVGHGVYVFPCRDREEEGVDLSTGEIVTFKEKTPYTSNGLRGATVTPRLIGVLFGERHPNALVGVPTGEKNGFWVLDLDRHGENDGHEWLEAMVAKHGDLPPTATATTANNGTHYYFKHVDGIRNRAALAPGVDTRGEGGYVIAPGSVMEDGRAYRWVDHDGADFPEIAEAPPWLVDMLLTQPPKPVVERAAYTLAAPVTNQLYVDRAIESELQKVASHPAGGRGHQLYASACAIGEFVSAGAVSRGEAEDALWAAARACGVAQTDGERETSSRIRRGLDKGGTTPREIPVMESEDTTMVSSIERMVAAMRKRAVVAEAQERDPEAPDAPRQKPVRERFEKTWFADIEEGKPKETFVKGVFGVTEFTTVSGLPGTGKSVIVTDIACHVAAGMEWHGRRVVQGLVVYVAAERKKLTERRMMAFRKRHGVQHVPLLVIGGRLDLTRDLKDAGELIAEIKAAEEETGLKCVWVILDTLTRVFGGGDQNASKDMGKFVQSCDEIMIETGAHVTAIHHTAWSGERGKGAIDLDGAVDASFMVKKDHGKYRLVCDGTNDGEDGDVLAFTMDSVEIGVDEDGEPTTAPVVVAAKGDAKIEVGGLKGPKGQIMDALVAAIEAGGIEPEGSDFPEGIMVIDREGWRAAWDAVRDRSSPTAAERTKKQFNRSPEALVEAGYVRQVGQWFWPS